MASSTAARGRSYGAGARILSIGIASTGVVTFAYFSVAKHVLDDVPYKRVALLWSILIVVVSVIYRPIEQLLSRTIADRRARGLHGRHPLRVPAGIQLAFALAFLGVALALRGRIERGLFDGSTALYWVLIVGVLAYGASYFARGWLAGHERFALYGGLVLLESCSRFLFPLGVAVGLATGQVAVALGMAAAPFVSLVVVPLAFSSRRGHEETPSGSPLTPAADAAVEQGPAAAEAEEAAGDLSLRRGTGFAAAVFGVMLAEQALLNAAVLIVDVTSTDRALAGFVFNVLLIARAPLQLFQAIQTSLLPHLASLEATESSAAFAGVVALALLAVGPLVMQVLLPAGHFSYGRLGLAVVALGMGLHLTAGTLNQAALARGRAGLAAVAWLLCAVLFVAWVASPVMADELTRVELGYFGATLLLSVLLLAVYRRPAR